MIERRTEKTIEEALSKYGGENHNDWAKYLQTVFIAYRSSIHAVTNTDLIFGLPCLLPIVFLARCSLPTPSDSSET